MKNADFLVKILSSSNEYWVICFRYTGASNVEFSSIAIIGIPYSVTLNRPVDEIRYKELDKLRDVHLHNIFLSENYPPFQQNINLYSAVDGFPITCNKKNFLKAAIQMSPSKDLFDYKELHKSLVEEETPL